MNVHFLVKAIVVVGISMIFSACTLFGGGKATKQQNNSDPSKAQSGDGKGSIINQELKKQYDMYQEIIQYQSEQDKKVLQQSEERYKKLKQESDKATKTEEKGTSSSSANQEKSTGSGSDQAKNKKEGDSSNSDGGSD
ncbi:hypothetical protein [Paenibacillus sp. SI8]|uniref:hypothetical protein n=1 Tax=unclassified Paenibacillus TaxID=185978 RepID=UPI003466BE7E